MNKKVTIIAVAALLLDQLSKMIVIHGIEFNESIGVIKNFFNLTYVQNTGAAWNILSEHTYLLVLISLFATLVVIKYIGVFKKNNRNILAFGLLLGGIWGNLIDRVLRGYVIDFLDFKIFGYNYPVFNLGDSAIFIGVVLLIIAILKGEDNEDSSGRKLKQNR